MDTKLPQKWHVGKEVPVATIVVLLIQTAGVIWWAASTSAKVDYVKESQLAQQIIQNSVDRKQDDDARRAEDRLITQLDKINTKIDKLIESRTLKN